MPQRFRVAAVQFSAGEDSSANRIQAERWVHRAAEQGAALVVLPEMFHCWGRWDAMVASAEKVPGATHDWLAELAHRHGIWLVAGSICERIDGESRCFNTSLFFNPDGHLISRYRKIHLFDAHVPGQAATMESDWFAPGAEPVTVDTSLGRISQAICYDLRFAELFLEYARVATELIVLPAAFTATTGRAHWETLIRARAIETQSYIIAANQIGRQAGTFATYGHSLIVDPWGRVLADAGDQPGLALADIDRTLLADIRRRLPVASHRRIGRAPLA